MKRADIARGKRGSIVGSQVRVSAVIRMKNLENGLYHLLTMLSRQTVKPSQLIIVDNYSSENEQKEVQASLSDMKRETFKNDVEMKLVFLSNREFSHPYSTNLGVHEATNELVCITNAHSLPTSLTWLEDGVARIKEPNVAGVGGFFYPKDRGLLRTLSYVVESQLKTITWISTMNCIIRRSIWEQYPFDENLLTEIPETRRYGGEDYDWNLGVMAMGHRIVLDPKFSIVHFHEKNFAPEIQRNLRNYFTFRKINKKIRNLKRPRESHTRVDHQKKYSIEIN